MGFKKYDDAGKWAESFLPSSRDIATAYRRAHRAAVSNQRRAERASLQQHRALLKQQAQMAKMQEKQRAAYEVEVFENRLAVLVSVHQECGESLDWSAIAQEPSPVAPIRSDDYERQARELATQYHPGFFVKLFGQEQKQRDVLEVRVQQAIVEDERKHQELLQQHGKEKAEWETERDLATRILKGEWKAYLEAVALTKPFADVEELGSHLTMVQGRKNQIEVRLQVRSERVIPLEIKSLLKSGKVSSKKMPEGRFNELYQDYVCGCLFRVARELFALLPVQTIVINCYGSLFDSSTGSRDEICLLSAKMPRDVIEVLNFSLLDPSDALSNFPHRMDFKKLKGFSEVEPM